MLLNRILERRMNKIKPVGNPGIIISRKEPSEGSRQIMRRGMFEIALDAVDPTLPRKERRALAREASKRLLKLS